MHSISIWNQGVLSPGLLLPGVMAQTPAQLAHFARAFRSRSSSSKPQSRTSETHPDSFRRALSSLQESAHLTNLIRNCGDDLQPKLNDPDFVLGVRSGAKSAETFFENNYGFSKEKVVEPASFQQSGFLRFPRVISAFPHLRFVRGFKSKRYSDEGAVPFKKNTPEEKVVLGSIHANQDATSKPSSNVKLSDLLTESGSDLRELLRNDELAKEERARIAAAVQGYAHAIARSEDGDSSGSKKRGFPSFWERLGRVATVMIILGGIVSLLKLSEGSLRITGVGNEIWPEDIEITFDDVRGCDEAKQELQEIVDFLMNPDKYSALGGKLPKGCLLIGPPGTGKTLLARAVAGQAGVPFFHASGSEFEEVFVGQGARRVRTLFRTAKKRAPCVIFIDEIDAVGSKRTSSVNHPYANQTINQLLSEMDGFLASEGVIVLGATNRSEVLDKALLRPGRFDTRVTVPNPDMKGRKEILQLYMSKIKHDDSVNIEKLAKMTIGFSGAELENMVNTAAIRAAVDGKDWVTMSEFEYSHDKHVLGTDWKSRVRDKDDLKITAFHEAGHTLVAYFTDESKPLHKVTIVARGQSGGHTAFLPDRDTYHTTRAELTAQMDVAMGGRAAEELVFGKDKVTGGASSDLETSTNIAEWMVTKLGMSDKLGLRVIKTDKDPFGPEMGQSLGQGTSEVIDSEVNRMLNESYKRASTILKAHRAELDLLAEALLLYETLDADDVKAIMSGEHKKVHKRLAATMRARGVPVNDKKFTEEKGSKITGQPEVLVHMDVK